MGNIGKKRVNNNAEAQEHQSDSLRHHTDEGADVTSNSTKKKRRKKPNLKPQCYKIVSRGNNTRYEGP